MLGSKNPEDHSDDEESLVKSTPADPSSDPDEEADYGVTSVRDRLPPGYVLMSSDAQQQQKRACARNSRMFGTGSSLLSTSISYMNLGGLAIAGDPNLSLLLNGAIITANGGLKGIGGVYHYCQGDHSVEIPIFAVQALLSLAIGVANIIVIAYQITTDNPRDLNIATIVVASLALVYTMLESVINGARFIMNSDHRSSDDNSTAYTSRAR